MIKKAILLLPLFMLSLFINAEEIKVKEVTENIGTGRNKALSVLILDADESMVEKAWKSLMKDYDAKVSMKDGVFADNAIIKDISENTIDVYAIVSKEDKGVRLTVAFDLGGAYLSSSSHSSAYKAAEQIIRKFAINISKKAIGEVLEDEKNKQRKMENNLSSLKKKNERLHNDIEDYKKKIIESEKDIETNLKDQEAAGKSIETQVEAVKVVQKRLDDVN